MSALRHAYDCETGAGTASIIYHDRQFQTQAVKVQPGEYYASANDVMIVTVLGSCVAACIRDPELAIGGMNHFLLPDGGSNDGARYGGYAMEVLVNELLHLGADRRRLVAKVFGGGNVVRSMKSTRVGERNADFVTEYLKREGIKILAADLLGDRARRVHYFPRTGQALVKTLGAIEVPELDRAERALQDSSAQPCGEVELFE